MKVHFKPTPYFSKKARLAIGCVILAIDIGLFLTVATSPFLAGVLGLVTGIVIGTIIIKLRSR